MARHTKSHFPLVYSCSGCSNVAQLANDLAVRLDREGAAEMSCIAGVGGDVRSLVRMAQADRPILAIDGCPLTCVRAVLARHAIEPTIHIKLYEQGLKKRFGEDCTEKDLDETLPLVREAARQLTTFDGAMLASEERLGNA